MSESTWEFAIDVGGTFTDCLARSPSGELFRHKLLSSGVTKGSIRPQSSASQIVDEARIGDPPEFWTGFRLRVLGADGSFEFETEVREFDNSTGTLILANKPKSSPTVGNVYELSCDLEAPIIGIRFLMGLPLAQLIPPIRLRLGTTRGTNALLTRSGARTALVTTRGFGDLLSIGYQDRPKLFDLTILKPTPLVETSIEIDERVSADGRILRRLEPAIVRNQLKEIYDAGIEALAICFLHADLYPEHERRVAAIATELGFNQVSCSSEVARLVKIVPRAETTVVDAYLSPVLRDYIACLETSLPGSQIRMMTSAGGLVAPDEFRGPESVLSGPAGGVVGYASAARTVGIDRAIGFDMGGTSTDVSRFDREYEFEYESEKAGARLVAASLAIETVAAGGGSICAFDGVKLTVGPDSAGSQPGPACYGRGGPLTVTDLNFFLGRVVSDRFPFELQLAPVKQRLAQLRSQVLETTGESLSQVELAEGLLQIANANMSRAVRSVSVAKGANPSDYALVAFGGAAAQHACAIGAELRINQALIHPDAGILSAYGISRADLSRHAVAGMANDLKNLTLEDIDSAYATILPKTIRKLEHAGCPKDLLDVQRTLDLRYVGTDTPLNIPAADPADLQAAFEQKHHELFGYIHEQKTIEVVAARVQVVGRSDAKSVPSKLCSPREALPRVYTPVWFSGRETSTPSYDWGQLEAGTRITGPALVADQHSTVVIEPGWQADLLSCGEILLTQLDSVDAAISSEASEPVMLEVFNNLFAGIAEQMGHVLRRTASSVNVKERLDFSCALFTDQGALIANAPHVPVHLGAMGATVRAIIEQRPAMRPGDVYVSNDPYQGGSHLPDVTVVSPVHDPDSGELIFFTACRAHHAEIGGIRPGSMPPSSTSLAEEGVLISNFALVDNGVSRESALRNLLTAGPYPSRHVEENLADLRAQVAANRQGAQDLLALLERYSLATVRSQMVNIQRAAESKVRQAIAKLEIHDCEFTDYLETAEGEKIPIHVAVRITGNSEGPAAVIDFSGTGGVVAGNLNANRAIVTAAVLYVLRLLVDEDIPLNEGALRAVKIELPVCLLNPKPGKTPDNSPAVAAGNVETSQRVVDVLLGALGIAGASQGTMNNLLFGNDSFGYYETIAGGSGGTADGAGADAVQVHMTNTRSTDPEILERRHPVLLRQFSIRTNSGGEGMHRGGNGVVRKLEFLEPLQVSLITGRRGEHPPYGSDGGSAGKPGKNILTRSDGTTELLPGICELTVEAGDVLTIETPGGGGYGVAR